MGHSSGSRNNLSSQLLWFVPKSIPGVDCEWVNSIQSTCTGSGHRIGSSKKLKVTWPQEGHMDSGSTNSTPHRYDTIYGRVTSPSKTLQRKATTIIICSHLCNLDKVQQGWLTSAPHAVSWGGLAGNGGSIFQMAPSHEWQFGAGYQLGPQLSSMWASPMADWTSS